MHPKGWNATPPLLPPPLFPHVVAITRREEQAMATKTKTTKMTGIMTVGVVPLPGYVAGARETTSRCKC